MGASARGKGKNRNRRKLVNEGEGRTAAGAIWGKVFRPEYGHHFAVGGKKEREVGGGLKKKNWQCPWIPRKRCEKTGPGDRLEKAEGTCGKAGFHTQQKTFG